MKNDFLLAISQLAAEKNLAREVIFQAVEAALASAYRRDGEEGPEVHVRISGETGDISAFIQKTVVRNVEDTNLEMDLEEASRYKPDARIDDVLEFEVKPPENAGRIAAQTAKQVVLQRLREAERGAIYEEYADKQGEVLLATVQRVESRQATVEIGRGTEALLPGSEMVRNEHLRAGQRVKVLLLEVNDEVKGPQVIVSRGHRLLLRRLLEVEVPEIAQGRVEVKAIAREGGHRSKVAVHGRAASVDPIGACVGMRGSRIQNVVNELGGERVDIIKLDSDPVNFVTNALSPAQVVDVQLDEDSREAVIVVPDSMLSLAIGKEGQNARLAAKLSGFRISIRSQTGTERDTEGATIVEAPAAFDAFPPGTEPDLDILQLPKAAASDRDRGAASGRCRAGRRSCRRRGVGRCRRKRRGGGPRLPRRPRRDGDSRRGDARGRGLRRGRVRRRGGRGVPGPDARRAGGNARPPSASPRTCFLLARKRTSPSAAAVADRVSRKKTSSKTTSTTPAGSTEARHGSRPS